VPYLQLSFHVDAYAVAAAHNAVFSTVPSVLGASCNVHAGQDALNQKKMFMHGFGVICCDCSGQASLCVVPGKAGTL
jgi:hypothetical protein